MKFNTSHITFLLLLFSLIKSTQAQILTSDRSVDWTVAGLKNKTVANQFTIIDMDDFNVVNDGVTANDSFLNNALQTIPQNGAILVFPKGDFLFNTTINLPSNVVLKGAGATETTLIMDLSGANHAIQIRGTISATVSTTFSESALKGANFINVSDTKDFKVGDWVQIFQEDDHLITSSWAANTVGQILEISEIAANKITFSSYLRLDFDIAKSPSIKKINPVQNVGIECLKIKRIDNTAPSQTSTISFEYAVNSWVTGIASEKTTFSHIEAKHSTNLYISKSYFNDAFEHGANGRAYGVVLHFTTNESLVENNIFKHLRHSMLVQAGANGNVFAYNYSIDPFWTSTPNDAAGDIVLHGNYPHSNLFEHNVVQNIVIDNSHGTNGKFNTFFRNRAENYGIFFSASNSPNQNFIGNEITKSSFPQNLVNYTILGSNHFVHGDNNKGNIVPTGTTNLEDKTYAYSSKPAYVSMTDWTSIGTPNVLNSGTIPAKERYVSGNLFDGNSCNSTPLNIEELEEVKIDIYPNPVKRILKLKSQKIIKDMKIVNQFGQLVLSEELNATSKDIDLSKLNSGMYFLKLSFKNGHKAVKKIVKF